jgi:hypothetical protein
MSCVGFSRASISTGQSGRLSDRAMFPIHITAQNRFFGHENLENSTPGTIWDRSLSCLGGDLHVDVGRRLHITTQKAFFGQII